MFNELLSPQKRISPFLALALRLCLFAASWFICFDVYSVPWWFPLVGIGFGTAMGLMPETDERPLKIQTRPYVFAFTVANVILLHAFVSEHHLIQFVVLSGCSGGFAGFTWALLFWVLGRKMTDPTFRQASS
jgi:hypothetical protein